jgi:exosortase
MLDGQVNQNDYSSILTFSVILFWYGAFIFFYGTQGFRVGIFPLVFLVFMIPIPSILMERVIYSLQVGSAEVSYLLFGLTGIPVSQNAFIFHLPGLNVEVAKQCSGIRSSLALFITSILAAQYFLQSGWKRIILILSVAPLAILKNGIRIVTLSLLGIYVDERFITQGFLHKSGGFVFFIPSLIFLGMILLLLRKSERA